MISKNKTLLHYGLQRSGTNFLEAMVKKNFKAKFLNSNDHRDAPIQKHFRLYDEKDIVPVAGYSNELMTPNFESFENSLETAPEFYLVISKDPYSWYISYLEWAKKCSWPKVAHHYVMEYNLFYGKWLEFAQQTDKIIFIRYIDLLADFTYELTRLRSLTGLESSLSSHFFNLKKVRKVSQSPQFSDDRRTYYTEKKYLDKLPSEALAEINRIVDEKTMSGLNYEFADALKPADNLNAARNPNVAGSGDSLTPNTQN